MFGMYMVALLDPVVGREGRPAGSRDPLRYLSSSITFQWVHPELRLPELPIGFGGMGATADFRTQANGPRQRSVTTKGYIGAAFGRIAEFTFEGIYEPTYPTNLTEEDIFQ